MKSLLSWFILLVSITLLVSSCASSDDILLPQVMKVQVPLVILIRPSWSWSKPIMKVPGATAPTVGTRSIQDTTLMGTVHF